MSEVTASALRLYYKEVYAHHCMPKRAPKGTPCANNFGDALNPWLWQALLRPEITLSPLQRTSDITENDKTPILVGIGTLLNHELTRDPTIQQATKLVMGTGVGYGDAPSLNGTWRVYAVRGYFSAQALNLPERAVVTDGAYLLPYVLPGSSLHSQKRQSVSYIPHHSTYQTAKKTLSHCCEALGYHLVNPLQPPQQVIEEIVASESVVCEAMHGAILADVYGVPWRAVYMPERYAAEAFSVFKWQDWCSSIGQRYQPILGINVFRSPLSQTFWRDVRRFQQTVENTPPHCSDRSMVTTLSEMLYQRFQHLQADLHPGFTATQTEAPWVWPEDFSRVPPPSSATFADDAEPWIDNHPNITEGPLDRLYYRINRKIQRYRHLPGYTRLH